MQFETISLAVSPRGIATILLNRPERGNAFNRAMLAELDQVFAKLAADDGTRIAVLRGNGKHFCVGADLADRDDDAGRAAGGAIAGPTLAGVLEAIDRLPKPTVAGIHGGAIGGGAAIATCCDIVVATEGAFFSIPEVRVGMAPVRLAPLFIRAMGLRNFRRYGVSGERFDAAEALRIGMAQSALRGGRIRWGDCGDRRCTAARCTGRDPRTQVGLRRNSDAVVVGRNGKRPGNARAGETAGSRRGDCQLSRKTKAELVPALSGRKALAPGTYANVPAAKCASC